MERLAQTNEEPGAPWSLGDQLRGTAEQVCRRRCVAPGAGVLSRPREAFGGARPELGVGRAELGSIAIGPLEVIAHDLVWCVVAESGEEPVGVRLVECGPLPLGDLVIRGVSDQGVTEPKSIVTRHQRPIGPDQLLAHEGEQVPAHVHAFRLGQQGGDSAAMEEASLDRAALDDRSLRFGQTVDTGGE